MVGWKRWVYKKLGMEYDNLPVAEPAALRGRAELLKQIKNSNLQLKPLPPQPQAQTEPVKVKIIRRKRKRKKKKASNPTAVVAG